MRCSGARKVPSSIPADGSAFFHLRDKMSSALRWGRKTAVDGLHYLILFP